MEDAGVADVTENAEMEDEGVTDVYRPMQLEQEYGDSQPTEDAETKDILRIGTLSPFQGEDLENPVSSLVREVGETEMLVPVLEEAETTASGNGGSGKRKRGRKAARAPVKVKKSQEEEDVCFICFDGGNLVLCDRRSCPKAYHPACVHRDEAFFKKKGRWYCGWHLCRICSKAAHFFCCTCTYSLCKSCIKKSDFFCLLPNKGLCVNCMKLVKLIENKDTSKEDVAIFYDKANWEYLFKEYWLFVKRKLSLTPSQVTNANNPWKGSGPQCWNMSSDAAVYNAKNVQNNSSGNFPEHLEKSKSSLETQRKKTRTSGINEGPSRMILDISIEGAPRGTDTEQWASKELLDFVEYMRGGRTTLSVFDVQSLLMDYVTKYKLRDPDKKSQVICDARLQELFGKNRVGHFEMLKLIESHILPKETPLEVPRIQGENGDEEIKKIELNAKKNKSKMRVNESTKQAKLADYAAVDVHNVNLIYLRRNLVEDLLIDPDIFREKIIGSFVRIRIPASGKKQDMYRLVKVVGTSQAAKPYKTGEKSTDIMLEIQNLNKTEAITIDSISSQEFSGEECKRLRLSMKYGLIGRLTVGEVQEKAKALQHVKVNDWFETEILRLTHLRDRASEKGLRKELRECVEKLRVLHDPDGRARKLQELPEVRSESHMDPNDESDDEEEDIDKRENHVQLRNPGHSKRGRESTYPKPNKDGWGSSVSWEKNKSLSVRGETRHERSEQHVCDSVWNQKKGSHSHRGGQENEIKTWNNGSDTLSSGTLQEISPMRRTGGMTMSGTTSEAEKMWHYCDPTGKIQGPFSMVQLQKWSTKGYFPADLRVWSASGRQDDSVLLHDALAGKLHRECIQLDLQGSSASKNGGVGKGYHDSKTRSEVTATWIIGTQGDRNSSFKASSSSGSETTIKDIWGTKSTGRGSSTTGSVEPKQGISASDPSGGHKSWFNHLVYASSSPRTNADNLYKPSSERNRDPLNSISFSSTPGSCHVVQSSGTRTATQGSVRQSSLTQVQGNVLQVHREKSVSEKLVESTSLATLTPSMERYGVAISSGNDWSDPPTPTPKSSGAEKLKDGASENQISDQLSDKLMNLLNNLHQQSSGPSAKSAWGESPRDGVSQSKTSPLQFSDEEGNNLEQQSPQATTQSQDEASQSKTSSPEIFVQPMNPVNNPGQQHSNSKTSSPLVSAEQVNLENNLEERPSVAEAEITPATANEQLSASGLTSVTEQDSALTTPDSAPIVGSSNNHQNFQIHSSDSSPEPVVNVVCLSNKNQEVDLFSAETVSSVGSGASNQCQLPSASPEDTVDDEIQIDSRDNGACNVISEGVHDSAEKLWADRTTVESLKQNGDSNDGAISSVIELTDVAGKDGKGSASPMLEPLETTDVLLANDDPATRMFSSMNDLADHLIPVDDIWDALGPDGAQSGCEFSPDEVISMEKVHASDALSLEDDDIMWHHPVSMASTLTAYGRTSDYDRGWGGNASESCVQSATIAFSRTQDSEMILQPVVNNGNSSSIVTETPGALQNSGLLSSQLDLLGRDGSNGHKFRVAANSDILAGPVSLNPACQSVNHLIISHPCPESDQDASAAMETPAASRGLSVGPFESVQGIQDLSRACASSPLFVSSGKLSPATSAGGTVPSIGQNAHPSNTVTKDSSVPIAANGRDILLAQNSRASCGFGGDFSTTVASASQTAPSSDSWYKSSKPNSDMSFDFLPLAETGNIPSVSNFGESGKRPITSEGWGAAANSPATFTGNWMPPSSFGAWRYGGGNEPSRPTTRPSQSAESSRTSWNPHLGNLNSSLGIQSENQKNPDGNMHSSYGDRGCYGAQGHGEGSWNRSAAAGVGGVLGGGGSGGPTLPRAQKVCKFHESGYCKNGASCAYWHT